MRRLPLTPAEREAIVKSVALYESLVSDLRDLLADGWPEHADLPDAPVVDAWLLGRREVVNLEGRVTGHPILAAGWTRTSPLHACSIAAGVARTQSRWYRLERPFGLSVGSAGRDDGEILPTCEPR